jgi:hypothetical protein
MAEHNHRLTAYGSQLCQPVLHQTRANALALPVRTHRHRGQCSGPDRPALDLDAEAAEQDVPDDLARVEGQALDPHQAVIPQLANERTLSVAPECGTIQIGNGRRAVGGCHDNLRPDDHCGKSRLSRQ